MSAIWRDRTIDWKEPRSWATPLSRWLRPCLNEFGIRHLQRLGEQDICWDDPAWLEHAQTVLSVNIDYVIEDLADALSWATIRAFHGCRTKDAGDYHRNGIRRNDPQVLANEVRRIVAEEELLADLRLTLEDELQRFDSHERDLGRLYVVVDDRCLMNSAGHYLLYGSEWVQCVLGWGAHQALRQRGFPTIIVVELPLSWVTACQREELARVLLQEWARLKVNKPDWVPELDFTFSLREDLPNEIVADHFHPEVICDPFYGHVARHVGSGKCPSCGLGQPISA